MTDSIVCSAGCKRTMPDPDAASAAGWECLAISTRWRCPDCTRELIKAREFVGTEVRAAASLATPGSQT